MPKTTSTAQKGSTLQNGTLSGSFIILTDGSKRVLVKRPASFIDAVTSTRRHFPAFSKNDVVFRTSSLEVCNRQLADVTPEEWKDLIPLVSELTVAKFNNIATSGRHPAALDVVQKFPIAPDADAKIKVYVVAEHISLEYILRRCTKFKNLFSAFARQMDKCPDSYKFRYQCHRVDPEETPGDLDMEDGDQIDGILEQCGGKPVIYLFSPQSITANVKLSLSPEWRFSAVYPVIPIKNSASQDLAEEIEWAVETRSDGTLHETKSQTDVAYLFWEAHTNEPALDTPPPSPVISGVTTSKKFIPNRTTLSDNDSVLLSIGDLPEYLEKALVELGLHTEARTSFITYWLPSFLKHKHVALRFVPQDAYEQAAPLEVTPAPDVVTRIFMLFQGVETEELPLWSGAHSRAGEDVAWWSNVVGVQKQLIGDTSLFRVMEWGGMEVYRSGSDVGSI